MNSRLKFFSRVTHVHVREVDNLHVYVSDPSCLDHQVPRPLVVVRFADTEVVSIYT